MRAGDRVLLQPKGKDAFMTKKLDPQGSTAMLQGGVKHDQIIGKRSRDTVKSTRGVDIRAFLPTLAEYVTLTPRIVTPVYPVDANLIVSLLDIHVDTYQTSREGSPLEILEGGTGHGSLTLHLARAVHAANPPLATNVPAMIPSHSQGNPIVPVGKAERQAIVHTIDVSKHHSEHARQTVSGFRQGLYFRNIDFHVGDVSNWIDAQFVLRGLEACEKEDKTFLSHIVLDMPNAQNHVEKAASALHVNGGLLVFNPSITQIMATVDKIKQRYLPLQLDRVLELGPYLTGGKEWDVRSVKPRVRVQAEAEEAARTARGLQGIGAVGSQVDFEDTAGGGGKPSEVQTREEEHAEDTKKSTERWEMVCRPKVGGFVVGGGFVGFWKKMKQ